MISSLIIRKDLHVQLQDLLDKTNDSFEPGMNYINRWDYVVDHRETIPYREINFRGLPIED